jgi:hypothetical protein
VAVLIPSIFIFLLKNDPTVKNPADLSWAPMSLTWGLLAGIAGAAGALCVIFAVKEAGSIGPLIVAPLVFAGAPIINTIASMTFLSHGKKFEAPSGLSLSGAGSCRVRNGDGHAEQAQSDGWCKASGCRRIQHNAGRKIISATLVSGRPREFEFM